LYCKTNETSNKEVTNSAKNLDVNIEGSEQKLETEN